MNVEIEYKDYENENSYSVKTEIHSNVESMLVDSLYITIAYIEKSKECVTIQNKNMISLKIIP